MTKRDGTLPIEGRDRRDSRATCTFFIRIGQSHRPAEPVARIVDLDGVSELRLGRGETDAVSRDGPVLRFDVADPFLSARHAVVRRFEAGDLPVCVLEDQGSTNGCRVNGRPVERHELRHGDIVETGQTFWKFYNKSEDSPREALLARAHASGPIRTTATVCPAMLHNLLLLERVANTEIPVILMGESGTGKEVLTAALHRRSGRNGGLMVVNCGAIPETLVESELFGHRKGSFTGAYEHRRGVVEAAHGGTLFLDELGDLAPTGQTALLRLIQEGSFCRVGETRTRTVDVRFVAATHRELADMVAAGAFRGDLYARLNGITIRLPRLSDRKEDIGLLLAAFLGRAGSAATLALDAYRALLAHDWPFNVRELEKVVTTALALAGDDPTIGLAHLPAALRGDRGGEAPGPGPHPAPGTADRRGDKPPALRLSDDELRARLVELLVAHRGNVAAVARVLRTSRTQVHRLFGRLNLAPGAFRQGATR